VQRLRGPRSDCCVALGGASNRGPVRRAGVIDGPSVYSGIRRMAKRKTQRSSDLARGRKRSRSQSASGPARAGAGDPSITLRTPQPESAGSAPPRAAHAARGRCSERRRPARGLGGGRVGQIRPQKPAGLGRGFRSRLGERRLGGADHQRARRLRPVRSFSNAAVAAAQCAGSSQREGGRIQRGPSAPSFGPSWSVAVGDGCRSTRVNVPTSPNTAHSRPTKRVGSQPSGGLSARFGHVGSRCSGAHGCQAVGK